MNFGGSSHKTVKMRDCFWSSGAKMAILSCNSVYINQDFISLEHLTFQDKLGGGFQRFQSFSGQVAWLNVWDYILDDTSIKRISEC